MGAFEGLLGLLVCLRSGPTMLLHIPMMRRWWKRDGKKGKSSLPFGIYKTTTTNGISRAPHNRQSGYGTSSIRIVNLITLRQSLMMNIK